MPAYRRLTFNADCATVAGNSSDSGVSMAEANQLEDDAKEKVKDFVQGQIEDGIRNGWDRIQDPGGWVSGRIPGPSAPGTLPATRAACRRWARGAGPQGPIADMTYRPFCEEYLDDIGELPSGGEFKPPFPGGQCPVQYRVKTNNLVTFEDDSTTTLTSGEYIVTGPISGLGSYPPGGACGSDTRNAAGFKANGNVVITGCTGGAKSIKAVGFALLQRVDGLPDNCGDTEDGYEPTAYLPDDGGGSEPISPPGFPPFTIDIGPDGDIIVNFPNFDGPGRGVDDPFIPPDPEDYGPQPEPPPAPGDNGEPDAPSESEPGGDVGYCKADEVLKGVSVELTQVSPRARVTFLGGEPHYSYAYSVFMGGEGGLERDNESAFARLEAFYHAPENANCFKVAFKNGFKGKVIPYWKPVEEE